MKTLTGFWKVNRFDFNTSKNNKFYVIFFSAIIDFFTPSANLRRVDPQSPSPTIPSNSFNFDSFSKIAFAAAYKQSRRRFAAFSSIILTSV